MSIMIELERLVKREVHNTLLELGKKGYLNKSAKEIIRERYGPGEPSVAGTEGGEVKEVEEVKEVKQGVTIGDIERCGGVEVKRSTDGERGIKRKKVMIPYCGVVDDSSCYGVKYAYGLFVQCTNDRAGDYCSGCATKLMGDIRKRGEEGWVDNKKRKPVRYANIAEKQNISLSVAVEYALSIGCKIPEIELIKECKRRGRPRKTGVVEERVIVSKKKEEPEGLVDQLNVLLAEANAELSEEEEEEGEIDVSLLEKMDIGGTNYYIYNDESMSSDLRVLIDVESESISGTYDITTKKVSEYEFE